MDQDGACDQCWFPISACTSSSCHVGLMKWYSCCFACPYPYAASKSYQSGRLLLTLVDSTLELLLEDQCSERDCHVGVLARALDTFLADSNGLEGDLSSASGTSVSPLLSPVLCVRGARHQTKARTSFVAFSVAFEVCLVVASRISPTPTLLRCCNFNMAE